MKAQILDQHLEKGYRQVKIFCPGCKNTHILNIQAPKGQPCWGFNGDIEKPTFTPSLLVRTGKYVPGHEDFDDEGFNLSSICHSFIREGKMEFLMDSTHELKGQTVELPELTDNN